MKALITKGYISTLHGSKDWKKFIEENQGKEVEIDTTHIFDNQYNTKDGFRIYDTHIDAIKDDVRTDEKVFFVKYPNGKDAIKGCDFDDHLKNRRFLSCYSVNGNYYRISRRSNIEFVLVGCEIYITNSIGYTPLKKAGLSFNEKQIVRYCTQRIIDIK